MLDLIFLWERILQCVNKRGVYVNKYYRLETFCTSI